jgi:hypothetical protein
MTRMVITDDIRPSRLKPGKKSAMETNKLLAAANTLYCQPICHLSPLVFPRASSTALNYIDNISIELMYRRIAAMHSL